MNGLAALRFAADLHDDALAFVEPTEARKNLALRQKRRALAANLDKGGAERRQQAHDAAKMNAASLGAVAAFDAQLDRRAVFDECRAPFAGPGGNQQFAAHRRR